MSFNFAQGILEAWVVPESQIMKVHLKSQKSLLKSIVNKFSFDSIFIHLKTIELMLENLVNRDRADAVDRILVRNIICERVLKVGLSFDKLFDFF